MKIHIIQKKLKKWFHGEYIMHNISIYFDHTRKEIYYSLLYKSTHIMYFASMHYNIKHYAPEDAYLLLLDICFNKEKRYTNRNYTYICI